MKAVNASALLVAGGKKGGLIYILVHKSAK